LHDFTLIFIFLTPLFINFIGMARGKGKGRLTGVGRGGTTNRSGQNVAPSEQALDEQPPLEEVPRNEATLDEAPLQEPVQEAQVDEEPLQDLDSELEESDHLLTNIQKKKVIKKSADGRIILEPLNNT
jgi:hypothetical protein